MIGARSLSPFARRSATHVALRQSVVGRLIPRTGEIESCRTGDQRRKLVNERRRLAASAVDWRLSAREQATCVVNRATSAYRIFFSYSLCTKVRRLSANDLATCTVYRAIRCRRSPYLVFLVGIYQC